MLDQITRVELGADNVLVILSSLVVGGPNRGQGDILASGLATALLLNVSKVYLHRGDYSRGWEVAVPWGPFATGESREPRI